MYFKLFQAFRRANSEFPFIVIFIEQQSSDVNVIYFITLISFVIEIKGLEMLQESRCS